MLQRVNRLCLSYFLFWLTVQGVSCQGNKGSRGLKAGGHITSTNQETEGWKQASAQFVGVLQFRVPYHGIMLPTIKMRVTASINVIRQFLTGVPEAHFPGDSKFCQQLLINTNDHKGWSWGNFHLLDPLCDWKTEFLNCGLCNWMCVGEGPQNVSAVESFWGLEGWPIV